MRVVLALIGLVLLGGCEPLTSSDAASKKDPVDIATGEAATALATTGDAFDYRYAFRMPGAKLKAVLQSHADACDRLGPARCRILAMRYRIDDAGQTSAVLTIRVDPAIARAFGDAATRTVQSAQGVLVDTSITGADSTSAARSNALIARLRDQLANAEATAQRGGDETGLARARAERIRSALATIDEVEAGQGQTMATTPVLITYASNSGAVIGGSPDASFDNAGDTLVSSLAGMAEVLAGVGPWLLLILVVVLLLRWLIHGTVGPAPAYAENAAVPVPHEEGHDDKRNLIHRWFAHDDGEREDSHH